MAPGSDLEPAMPRHSPESTPTIVETEPLSIVVAFASDTPRTIEENPSKTGYTNLIRVCIKTSFAICASERTDDFSGQSLGRPPCTEPVEPLDRRGSRTAGE